MADLGQLSREELEREIIRLRKVNEALMDRVERGGIVSRSPFSLFEKNVNLSSLVKERTLELEKLTFELEGEKNRLSGIIQALPGALFFFNKSYGVDVSFTTLFERRFRNKEQLTLEEALGKDFFEVVKSKVEGMGRKARVVNFDYQPVSGQFFFYYNCSISTRDQEQYVLYIQDNSEKYLQERLIKEQEAKILQSSKLASLGEMAAGVAHEINNPLATINLAAFMLKKHLNKLEVNSTDITKKIETIEQTVMRISKIISVMRNISREANDFYKDDVRLMDIINDVLALCGQRFANNNLQLKINIRDEAKNIWCDKIQIAQVLLNLLNNAYDATEGCPERWIEVNFEEDEKFDYINVKNNGRAIPQSLVSKIFEPFFTTKEVGKGTGLGLSISKAIMDKHEGSIDIGLNIPHTCFTLKLPKRQTP